MWQPVEDEVKAGWSDKRLYNDSATARVDPMSMNRVCDKISRA